MSIVEHSILGELVFIAPEIANLSRGREIEYTLKVERITKYITRYVHNNYVIDGSQGNNKNVS